MNQLMTQVQQLTHAYVRKGGKDNRRQQRQRMIAFAAHAAGLGAREMAQVGGRHVVSFFRSQRDLRDSTRYSYWLAICELWRLSKKSGEPSKPHRGDGG